jgi:two-component system NarL family response regulator
MTEAVSVLIVDDHEVVRRGLAAIIDCQTGMRVAGEAGNGADALDAYRRLLPSVVLMDLRMPEMSGWIATARIRAEFPESRILILTTLDGDEDIFRALQAGAMGYLLKDTPSQQLIAAIRAAHAGLKTISPAAGNSLGTRHEYGELTGREVAVLRSIAAGAGNKQIAFEMDVSESTIKGHVSNILLKLGAPDRTGAVMIALRRGIVTLD